MDETQFKELNVKLDKIVKLLALLVLKDQQKETDKIELLDSLGFRPIEISGILSKSLSNVTTTLTLVRKKDKKLAEESSSGESS